MGFTAQEIVEQLQSEGDTEATLRMVRYYTQIGMVPDLELIGNRRMYTKKHLDYFRAIRTMSKTGQKLADIQKELQQMEPERIKRIGHQMPNFTPEKLFEAIAYEPAEMEQIKLHSEVILQISSHYDAKKKEKIVAAVKKIVEE
ncbi:MerR family transcriptional regulator [Neobacillus terrae]|uniref:MerR family transcriptional regulator n=1 Tax=Neobacillus terrae TaxID=3034837 RepID=UPI00140A2378|nr:MerR family transcriptional regulator [Neobacillus terrae]NHM33065.1 MerR family transcriptional regulator [Neobacillus terrae]